MRCQSIMNLRWLDTTCILHLFVSWSVCTFMPVTESGSAKFFVKGNGDSVLQNKGILTDREVNKIQEFIKENYEKMYEKWVQYSENGFYRG